MPLTVEIVRQPEKLIDEWHALTDACVDRDVFLQPFFLLTWGEIVAETWKPEYLAVREDTKLIGLLPMFRRSVLGCRILGFPVLGTTPPMDLIVEAGREVAVAQEVKSHLANRRDWDLLWLHQIDLQRRPAQALLQALTPLGDLTEREAGATFVIDTSTGHMDDFMRALPARFRKEVERWGRRYCDLGDISNIVCPQDASVSDVMPLVGSVLEKSWKGANNTETMKSLQRLAEAAATEGKLHLSVNLANGVPTSYLLSFDHGNRIFPFHIAYDLEYRQIGPGQLQIRAEIERALLSDVSEIDLGGGYSYLAKWATGARNFTELRVVRPALRSRTLANAYLKRRDRRHAEARNSVEEQKQRKKEGSAQAPENDT